MKPLNSANQISQAQVAAEAATMGAAAAAVAPEFRQPAYRPQPRDIAPSGPVPRNSQPSRIIYVGNLFFEVTAQQLEAEFSQIGQITNSRVVTDARGLSKGFGYVEFATQEAADRAVRETDQKVFQGRRMAVQYHVRREPRRFGSQVPPGERASNAPSKTLFIGNMSYQMSDRDLNGMSTNTLMYRSP